MFKSKLRLTSFVLCAAFTMSCFSGTIVAHGASVSDLRNEIDKIENKIDEMEGRLGDLQASKAETEEYLNTLMSKINLLQDKIDNLEEQKSSLQAEIDAIQENIRKTEDELKKTQAEIDKKQAEFDDNYELYCQRLKSMYMSGSVTNLEVLLTCEDMSSMLTRSQMIKSVAEQDSEQLDALMKIMEEIESKKQELEIKRNELNEDKVKLEENKSSLQSSINQINASKSEYDAQANEANALIKKLSSQSIEIKELIEDNEDEIQQIRDEIRRLSTPPSTGGSMSASHGSGSGALGYPTDSRTISAGFPYYSSGGWHGGIDFPVPSGSNVYAAGSGTVIIVKHLTTSYGYYIVIDHGDGLTTLYAHNSEILVSVGQSVSRGELIAHSGSTGNSTGPHCHFETLVNGTQVSPWNYL